MLPGRSFGLGADERALKIAGNQPAPERVLLNIMMPDMDGYAVCRHLKFDFRTHQIPIIHYDGPLLDNLPGADIGDYIDTMRRLRELPVSVVHAGHDPSFGRARLRELADAYIDSRQV